MLEAGITAARCLGSSVGPDLVPSHQRGPRAGTAHHGARGRAHLARRTEPGTISRCRSTGPARSSMRRRRRRGNLRAACAGACGAVPADRGSACRRDAAIITTTPGATIRTTRSPAFMPGARWWRSSTRPISTSSRSAPTASATKPSAPGARQRGRRHRARGYRHHRGDAPPARRPERAASSRRYCQLYFHGRLRPNTNTRRMSRWSIAWYPSTRPARGTSRRAFARPFVMPSAPDLVGFPSPSAEPARRASSRSPSKGHGRRRLIVAGTSVSAGEPWACPRRHRHAGKGQARRHHRRRRRSAAGITRIAVGVALSVMLGGNVVVDKTSPLRLH